jgi:hypothetical protein
MRCQSREAMHAAGNVWCGAGEVEPTIRVGGRLQQMVLFGRRGTASHGGQPDLGRGKMLARCSRRGRRHQCRAMTEPHAALRRFGAVRLLRGSRWTSTAARLLGKLFVVAHGSAVEVPVLDDPLPCCSKKFREGLSLPLQIQGLIL